MISVDAEKTKSVKTKDCNPHKICSLYDSTKQTKQKSENKKGSENLKRFIKNY